MPRLLLPLLLTLLTSFFSAGGAPILNQRQLLETQNFWDNRDFDWFEDNIPFLDTPDEEINTTYYYRWELVSKHLTYGSPTTGYLWTEFINRPFWSGAYGAIACPSGHQFYEARWLRNPRYVRDYARYWFRTPGAQPHRYSAWMADSAWATHLVHPNKNFLANLLPDLRKNLDTWTSRSWVKEAGMFWQVGHDDGMEFNIASRQTKNILSGAPSYRPSFNSYMWADLKALARISHLLGDHGAATSYEKQAGALKDTMQKQLWDPQRKFFLAMFRDDEEDGEGNRIKKNTRIYETGKFAGSPHGREEAGYVPWSFNLPDPGYEEAWKFLMDPAYFFAEFGPVTVERNDPLFLLKNSCCWWSGQSWPFATTQTLKGLANLLHNYSQDHVSRKDYYKLLHIYARSHRKNGKPYIAEALHPDTGSWDHHDFYNRSEHYFHSGFVDLIITGLCGLILEDKDTLTVDPLIPESWDYFALDEVPYRGHLVSLMWDRDGSRYDKGAGLHLFANGKKIASAPTLGKLSAPLPAAREVALHPRREVNYAVNNDGTWFPRYRASHTGPKSSLSFVHDGNTAWYDLHPPLRWTCEESPNDKDWVEVDFGTLRPITTLKAYLLDDGNDQPVTIPTAIQFEYSVNGDGPWQPVPSAPGASRTISGGKPFIVQHPGFKAQRIRVTLTNRADQRSGLTELEAWGPLEGSYLPAPAPAGNIAFNPDPKGGGFPKASASFHDRYGGVPSSAHDGIIIYRATPTNRWTCYGSPDQNTDWFALDFGEKKTFSRAILHLYDDRGGVQAPKRYTLQHWTGQEWMEIPGQQKTPTKPKGSAANTVIFPPVESEKLRVVFTHIGKGHTRSGLTEIEVWDK